MDLAYRSNFGLNPEQYRTFSSWHKIIAALLLLLLLLLWLFGYGPGAYLNCLPAAAPKVSAPAPILVPPVAAVKPAPAPAPAVAPQPPTAIPSSPPPKPVTTPPNARVYFALDKFGLPDDTPDRLAKVVAYLKANPSAKASLSGFHDPSGSRARNIDLALNRARAVRGALEKAGIAQDRIVMQKPIETTGSGEPREARRVEVEVMQ